jgi:hypothetical protein
VRAEQDAVAVGLAWALINDALSKTRDRGYVFDDAAYGQLQEFVRGGTKHITDKLGSGSVGSAAYKSARAKEEIDKTKRNLDSFTEALMRHARSDDSAVLTIAEAARLLGQTSERMAASFQIQLPPARRRLLQKL